jgi:hypothetical protein
MGQESMLYEYKSSDNIKNVISSLSKLNIKKDVNKNEFIIKFEESYFELKIENWDEKERLFIRYAKCNSLKGIRNNFRKILSILFSFKNATLFDLTTYKEYTSLTNIMFEEIINSFQVQRTKVMMNCEPFEKAISTKEYSTERFKHLKKLNQK